MEADGLACSPTWELLAGSCLRDRRWAGWVAPVALLLFLLCLPVWISAPPSLLGLTSQLDSVAQWSPVPVSATKPILLF